MLENEVTRLLSSYSFSFLMLFFNVFLLSLFCDAQQGNKLIFFFQNWFDQSSIFKVLETYCIGFPNPSLSMQMLRTQQYIQHPKSAFKIFVWLFLIQTLFCKIPCKYSRFWESVISHGFFCFFKAYEHGIDIKT